MAKQKGDFMTRMQEQSYEAVRIRQRDDLLHHEVYTFQTCLPDDGMIVRNLFSLTGTHPEETFLASLSQTLHLPHHPGYVSLGRVERAGKNCHGFREGDEVLLPAQYSTYTTFERTRSAVTTPDLLRKVSSASDPLCNLFVPLVSLALYQAEHIQDMQCDEVIFVGCGLLGAILLPLLKAKYGDMRICVVKDEIDLKATWLRTHGADEVIAASDLRECQIFTECAVCLFTSASWTHEVLSSHRLKNAACLSMLNGEGEPGHWPWLDPDHVEEAASFSRTEFMSFSDVIAQHIHAEAAQQVYEDIVTSRYHGKAIVYDW
jgi:hypothetical protein